MTQAFLDLQLYPTQKLGDMFARIPMTVEITVRIKTMGHLFSNGLLDFLLVMVYVDYIRTSISSLLPAADVNGGRPQIGPLSNGDAGIAGDAGALVKQRKKILGGHVLKKMDEGDLVLLPEHPDPLGDAVGTGIDIGPKPDSGGLQLRNGIQGDKDLLAGLLILGGDRVLHDNEEGPICIDRRP